MFYSTIKYGFHVYLLREFKERKYTVTTDGIYIVYFYSMRPISTRDLIHTHPNSYPYFSRR